ncbi:MAG: 30S ribosomal protein S27e [Candidatus Heimdallarchaeota archaeon]|nr:30S ribosomal protein S27e [Candidatus Heimdallarchaeota archaeon]
MSYVQSPKSKFLKVKCTACETEMIIFNHTKTAIFCSNEECNEAIATPLGGKAEIHAEIIEEMDDN